MEEKEIYRDVIDYYEIIENKLKVFYMDDHIETFPYTKEKEQELLTIELNQLKKTENVNKDENFDFYINLYKGLMIGGSILDVSVLAIIGNQINESIKSSNKPLTIALSILALGTFGIGCTLIKYVHEKQKEEKDAKDGISLCNLYLENMNILTDEIEIVQSDQTVTKEKVTPNNLDDFEPKELEDAIIKIKQNRRKLTCENL